MLDLLGGFAEILLTQGRSVLYYQPFRNPASYEAAVRRLERQGLIVRRPPLEGPARIELSPVARERLRPTHDPWSYWRRRWNGWWYLFCFDVPEAERSTRDVLRGFLKILRMGCLQRSLWVTPHDVRPAYDDLLETTLQLRYYTHLFEAHSVLRRGPQEVVRDAWKWERITEAQRAYLKTWPEQARRLSTKAPEPEEAARQAREEMVEYVAVMSLDPLLPQALWPSGYVGHQVYEAHQTFLKVVGARLTR